MERRHTFAICAYGSSPYLENCIASLESQTVSSDIIISTSTDNDHIRHIAADHGLPVYVSPRPSGIGRDWNFALSCVATPYATLAHQDDLYLPTFAQRAIEALNSRGDSLISFTNYCELRGTELCAQNRNLIIKDILIDRYRLFFARRRSRPRSLSMGNFICCPSVSFNLPNLPGFAFREDMKCSLDWAAWADIFGREGGVEYINEALMSHRIHEGSETTRVIESNERYNEDLALFRTFWPDRIAGLLAGAYSAAQNSNGSGHRKERSRCL